LASSSISRTLSKELSIVIVSGKEGVERVEKKENQEDPYFKLTILCTHKYQF